MQQIKLVGLILFSIGGFALGKLILPPETAITVYRYTIYWVLAGITGWLIFTLYRTGLLTKCRVFLRNRSNWLRLVFLLLASLFLHIHERHNYKVVDDEPAVVAIAQNLHQTRVAGIAYRAYRVQGVIETVTTGTDKRPAAFPFVISLIHDLTGYRPGNVFIANFLLGCGIILAGYGLGKKIGGEWGGWLFVLSLIFIPQLSRSVCGAGLETMNLLSILLLWLSLQRYLEKPDGQNQTLVCMIALLLFNTRMESPIFALTIAAIFLITWWQQKQISISWGLLASPLLLIPALGLRRVTEINADWWEMDYYELEGTPFSLSYIPEKLSSTLQYFTDLTQIHPNNALLFGLGMISLPLFLHASLTNYRNLRDVDRTFLAMLISFAGYLFILSIYYTGHFTATISHRLALPLFLPLIAASVWFFCYHLKPKWAKILPIVLLAAYALTNTLPTIGAHIYSRSYGPSQQLDWFQEKMAVWNDSYDSVMVDDWSFFWIAHNMEAVPTEFLLRNKGKFKLQLSLFENRRFLYCERVLKYSASKREVIRNLAQLDQDFRLKLIDSFQFNEMEVIRIYEIVDVEGVEPWPLPKPSPDLNAHDVFLSLLP